MNQDQQLAAFATGIIQVALGEAVERGYPAAVGPLRVDVKTGVWQLGMAGSQGSACTVTVSPGKA